MKAKSSLIKNNSYNSIFTKGNLVIDNIGTIVLVCEISKNSSKEFTRIIVHCEDNAEFKIGNLADYHSCDKYRQFYGKITLEI